MIKHEVAEEELRKKLQRKSNGDKERKLVKNKVDNGYETNNVVFYLLQGSPPKGYAVHIPAKRKIHIYDSEGQRWQILEEVKVVDQ